MKINICLNHCYSAAVLRNIRKIFLGITAYIFGGTLTLYFKIVFFETSGLPTQAQDSFAVMNSCVIFLHIFVSFHQISL